MDTFRESNMEKIKSIFEEKTGVSLRRCKQRHHSVKRVLLFAAVLVFALSMTAFTYTMFTPLDGDALSLSATYEGNGIIAVVVDNQSNKDLKFEEQLKVIAWDGGEELKQLDGDVKFSHTEFKASTNGTMTVDLSEAYDIKTLEQELSQQWYYLLLTNNSFLFGHDWICSISFGEKQAEETESRRPHIVTVAERAESIEEELRYYFEDAYNDTLPVFNSANSEYFERARELLLRFDGRVVTSTDPMLIVGRTPENVVFDESYPMERQYELVGENWHVYDGYGRAMGATDSESALTLSALLPQTEGEIGGGTYIPLIYMFTYDVSAIESMDDYAFIYGQLLPFGELEQYKVYQDEQYVVYEVTDLMYTDLDAYVDYYVSSYGGQLYFDDQVRTRIENIYRYYKDHQTIGEQFYYKLPN